MSSAAQGTVRAARARPAGGRAAGVGGVGREQLATEAERVGAWRGAQGGGRPGRGLTSRLHMPPDTLWKKKGLG